MSELSTFLKGNIEKILKPITAKNPVGDSLIYDPLYDQIKKARTQEDETLSQGVWQRPLHKVDWHEVETLCIKALQKASKDLQIVAWLTETWLNLYGLEGLQGGLEIFNKLCRQYWEDLYPTLRENDVEFRLVPFEWIDEKAAHILRLFPITSPPSEREKNYSLLDWRLSTQQTTLSKNGGQKGFETTLTTEQFNASRDATPSDYYQNIYARVSVMIQLIQSLNEYVMQKIPSAVGLFYHMRDELKAMMTFVEIILSARGLKLAEKPSYEMREKLQSIKKALTFTKEKKMDQTLSSFTLSSRAEAYALLDQIATYLSTIEPHSPTPLLLRRAIAWGKMSLTEILQELAHDKNDFLKIQSLMGNSVP